MQEKIIIDNTFATVRHNTQDNYLHHTFHQPISGQPFRTIMNEALDYLTSHQVTKWLSDDRKNAAFRPEDVEFAVADWGPRAAEAGWQHWALVVPEQVAARASMNKIVSVFFTMGVKVVIFTDLNKAKR